MFKRCTHRPSDLLLESIGIAQSACNGMTGVTLDAFGAARRQRTHLTLLQRAGPRH